MYYQPIQRFAFINTEQILDADLCKLLEAKPTSGSPLVYRAGVLDAGLFVLISEEEDAREADFANYSDQMRDIVEWAARQGALYLMLSNDCLEANFEADFNPAIVPSKSKADLAKFAQGWAGDDLEECLQAVYDNRTEAEF